MGTGIAAVAIINGLHTVLCDTNPEALERSRETIEKGVRKSLGPQAGAGEVEALLTRLSLTGNVGKAQNADLAIEAIPEVREAKESLMRRLDSILGKGAVLASNTSSISITELAGATGRPDRVIGIHFMNPVPKMSLVEVIPGLETTHETLSFAVSFVRSVGKTPVTVDDAPGFVANRLLMPFINESFFLLTEGVAEAAEIDTVMRLGANHPMGPLELADLIGLDTCLAILEVLHAELGEDKYRPAPLLRRYVRAGRLGRKSGRGVYDYT